MEPRLRSIFEEELDLDDRTPRELRRRISSFAPLLRKATSAVQLAATEIATAFAKQREPDSTIQFRLLADDDLFRIEISDSLTESVLLSGDDREQLLRRKVLDGVAYRWGILGDGSATVWCEIAPTAAPPQEVSRS